MNIRKCTAAAVAAVTLSAGGCIIRPIDWPPWPAPLHPRLEDAFSNSLGMTFRLIHPGTFRMGSPENEPFRGTNETQHQVRLTKAYYMQTTEVTQGQWQAVMGSNPSQFQNCGPNCPVENVSWYDVQDFIAALNQRGEGTYRLPNEAEWEYAARAGTTTTCAAGNFTVTTENPECVHEPTLDVMAWQCGNVEVSYSGCPDFTSRGGYSCAGPTAVAQKRPNAWGLYDMHGNVHEWCQDWYSESYPAYPVTDPTGPDTGSTRVDRGGSWAGGPAYCRSAWRNGSKPDEKFNRLGFRLAFTPAGGL